MFLLIFKDKGLKKSEQSFYDWFIWFFDCDRRKNETSEDEFLK